MEDVVTDRFLIGRHPSTGVWGCWLTMPGHSVFNTGILDNPDYMLLTSSLKTEQVIATGVIFCANGANEFIPFPFALNSNPGVIIFPTSNPGLIEHPPHVGEFYNTSLFGTGAGSSTGITVSNNNIGRYLFYAAITRMWQ
jgi:hypothetical protein